MRIFLLSLLVALVFIASSCETSKVNTYSPEATEGLIALMNTVELGLFPNEEDLDSVKKYIEQGADINAKDERGNTPLHIAARYSNVDFVRYLLDNGAEVNARGINNNTPLHWAAWRNNPEIAQLLIEKGADKNARCSLGDTASYDGTGILLFGSSGLIFEPDDEELESVRTIGNMLLEGRNINSKEFDGWTPLHFAARNYSDEAALVLLQQGAEVNASNYVGKAPLSYAKSEKMKKLLISFKGTE